MNFGTSSSPSPRLVHNTLLRNPILRLAAPCRKSEQIRRAARVARSCVDRNSFAAALMRETMICGEARGLFLSCKIFSNGEVIGVSGNFKSFG